jgi:hypothetical protein
VSPFRPAVDVVVAAGSFPDFGASWTKLEKTIRCQFERGDQCYDFGKFFTEKNYRKMENALKYSNLCEINNHNDFFEKIAKFLEQNGRQFT